MNRHTQARWQAARTLRELGELTALWLEGKLPSQPGYMPNCGPDKETRSLIPVLARANRAGFLTDGSQPGEAAEIGYDGASWTQRAAVEGWMEPDAARPLIDLAVAAGLIVVTHSVRRWRLGRRERDWVDVTRREGRTVTGFGRQRTRSAMWFQYDVCDEEAVRAVLNATQVTLAAPRYGPDDRVWRVLDQWVDNSEKPPG